jgi:diaminopimelate epimerase
VDDLAAADLAQIGPAVEQHPAFPEGVNVHLAQVLSPDRARIRTWERGAGLTLA